MSDVPLFHKVFSFYERWYALAKRFPKQDRFLIGTKIDALLLESLVSILQAGYAAPCDKHGLLQRTPHDLDTVKIMIRLAYRIKAISEKQYIAAQNELQEIGRMLGGWIRSVA